jgi:hypothetical protein
MPPVAVKSRCSSPLPFPKKGTGRAAPKVIKVGAKKKQIPSVTYLRHGVASAQSRGGRASWQHSLLEIWSASDDKVVTMLKEDGFLKNRTRTICPRCGVGALGPTWWSDPQGKAPCYKCNWYGFKKGVHPHAFHPICETHRGNSILKDQAAMLFAIFAGVKNSQKLIFQNSHKVVERLTNELSRSRAAHVESQEVRSSFSLRSGATWKPTRWMCGGALTRSQLGTEHPYSSGSNGAGWWSGAFARTLFSSA